MNSVWGIFFLEFGISLFMVLLWVFTSVHAMQHIEDPLERSAWFAFFVVLFWMAPLIYLISKYRKFARSGKKGWMSGRWMFGSIRGQARTRDFQEGQNSTNGEVREGKSPSHRSGKD